jgi:hypothetical protein
MSTKSVQKEVWNPLKDVNTWWFGYGSPVTFAVLRIIMSLLALEALFIGLMDFEAWYTEKGFFPLRIDYDYWIKIPAQFNLGPHKVVQIPHLDAFPRINFFGYAYDTRIALALYLIVMLAAVMSALGLFTRASMAVLALGLISVHHRNPLILHSGDTLLRVIIIFLAFAPCGSACSLDRVIGLWKGTAPAEPPRVSVWPQRFIEFQIALVYFITVWFKWFGTFWKDGTASWYPENLNEFYRFPIPEFTHHQPFLAITTYGTLVVELSLATLVFHKPLRKYVLLAGIAMHGYIEYRFNIPLFATIIVGGYVAFYDGEEISAWAKRFGAFLEPLRVHIRLPSGRCLKPGPARALAAMDPFGLVVYESGDDAAWCCSDAKGRSRKPFSSAGLRSIGAWPIAIVPGLWKKILTNCTSPESELRAAAQG